MNIYIGADHRGFELKQKLVVWLKTNGHKVNDCGNEKLDPNDDYPQFGAIVAEQVSAEPESLGIVLCGSGIGMCVVANKVADVRCILGFNIEQVKHGREADNCNVLSLPADHIDATLAQKLMETFINTKYQINEARDRRQDQIHKIEFKL